MLTDLSGAHELGKEPAAPSLAKTLLLSLVLLLPVAFAFAHMHYLVFHTAVEITGAVVALFFFILAWSAWRGFGNTTMLGLATGYLLAGIFDVFHALAFEGMAIVPRGGVNFAAQLWLSARSVEVLALFLFPLYLQKKLRLRSVCSLLVAVAALCVLLLVANRFPVCFVPGSGLTAFKIGAEYGMVALLGFSLWNCRRQRSRIGPVIYPFLIAAQILTMLSELVFTLYAGPDDLWNFSGHILKVLSFVLIFQAFVYQSLVNPWRLINAQVLSEIDERRRAEEEAVRRTQILENILGGANAGSWEWNVQSGETVFNERWAEIIGCTMEELGPTTIETWMHYAHPEDLARSDELLRKHFAGETEFYECECRMRHKNGDWIWVLDTGRLLSRDAEGQPLLMYGTHLDITARKAGEIALRQQERAARLFGFMVHNAPVGIHLCEENGTIVYANEAYCTLQGCAQPDIIGRHIADMSPRSITRDSWKTAWQSFVQHGALHFEDVNTSADGTEYPVEVHVKALCFQDTVYSCSFVNNISERRGLEMQVLKTVDDERSRIGQELHDSVCQDLKYLELRCALLRRDEMASGPGGRAESSEIEGLVRDVLTRTVGMAHSFIPSGMSGMALPEALCSLVAQMQERFPGCIQVDCSVESGDMGAEAAWHWYCIAREALLNAVVHSGGIVLGLVFSDTPGGRRMTVTDNGDGFDFRAVSGSLGINGMRLRAKALSAHFSITSSRQSGTLITVEQS